MAGLAGLNPLWDQSRAEAAPGRIYEDDSVLIATDFEGGNGTDIRRLGPDRYAITLEPEPGSHRFSGRSYYFCFGVRNKRAAPATVRVTVQAQPHANEDFGGIKHAVVRRGARWSQLDPANVHPAAGQRDALDLDVPLPGAGEPGPTLFLSDFHWWPNSEVVAFLGTLGSGLVRELGRSHMGRPIYVVEMGREGAPCIVNTATPQPSEMGHLACKAMIDYLQSGETEAEAMLDAFRLCFVPVTNPDGLALGYGVSDGQGRFPYFEADQAARGEPTATPEMVLVWRYLETMRPWLFWEWHSNNWHRRPGHMLLRYRHELLASEALRSLWDGLEERLLALPDTHHGNWTSHDEGSYQSSLGFQAITRLGAISCMIKQHDKFPIEQSRDHAVACLKAATQAY